MKQYFVAFVAIAVAAGAINYFIWLAIQPPISSVVMIWATMTTGAAAGLIAGWVIHENEKDQRIFFNS
jgi:hypothetical protein